MIGIIARKIGMTSVFKEGKLVPCTTVQLGECVVTQVKTEAKDGYSAIQVGYGEKKEKNTTKPLKGHFKAASTAPKRKLVEFRDYKKDYPKGPLKPGDQLKAAVIFEEGEFIDVVNKAKGKGFTGVMKRHGFSGVGDKTHGQHNRQRAPGSIGAGSTPSRVFKGLRMAGQKGGHRVKMQNVQILKIVADKDIVVLKGSVPGPNKSYLILQK